MTLSLRSTGVALGAALLASAATAATASATTTTQVSFSSGTLTVQAASGQANLIAVSNATGGQYRIKDLGTGAVLGYTTAGFSNLNFVSAQEGLVTPNGTVTRVVIRAEDDDDSIITNGLAEAATQSGGSGDDSLLGGPGDSILNGGSGDDSVSGGSGNDTISGGIGIDALYGNGGNDSFFEYDGYADTLNGGSGTDNAQVDGDLDSTTAIESVTLN